jgi:hypothetical protein
MVYLMTYNQNNQIKKNEMGIQVARMGEKRNAYRALVRKPEGKSRLGKPRRRWETNIEIDIGEIGWGGMDWVDLA